MSSEVAYWFPKWMVLCSKSGKSGYNVINGAWYFRYDPTTGLKYYAGKRNPISLSVDTPVKVTKEEFKEMGFEPNDWYW